MVAVRDIGAATARMRAAWIENGEWQHHDLFAGTSTPANRRLMRSNADLSAIYSALFAGIRRRSRMVTKLKIELVRQQGTEFVEVPNHPALDALNRVNESLTRQQGFGLIEQHKLTWGKAYWIKRRNGLGVPVEFEIWPPDEVEVIPDGRKPWTPAAFKRHLGNGTSESVAPRDVVWFRHMIDPRNPLNGLSPIGAVRVQVDTGLEALRYNQRFFDNDTAPSRIFTVEEGGPAEAARIEQELERKFKGTDNAHRAMVTEGGLKLVEGSSPISHKDMQFLEQMLQNVHEVARVLEMHPTELGVGDTTFSNVGEGTAATWDMIVDQVSNTLAEFNEFFLWPDFGREFMFIEKHDHIRALAPDMKLQAEIDDIHLKGARVTINQLRERDGEDPVPWGDTPIVQNTLEPLDMRTGAEKDAAAIELNKALKPQNEPDKVGSGVPSDKDTSNAGKQNPRSRSLADEQAALDEAVRDILKAELRGVIRHLDAADRRALRVEDVLAYGWDWLLKHGAELRTPLVNLFELSLEAESFKETPLLPTHQLAVRYAEARAAELLSDRGRQSISVTTRDRVRELVTKAIENGDSMRTLKNQLRQDGVFSDSRAETISRTETAIAQGEASLKSYQSNGYEGKRWLTSGFDVDNGDAFGPCVLNEAAGPIALHEAFPSGDETVPAHPRCRCTIVPVFEMPRRTIVHKKGTLDGREIDIVETTEVR